jgi:hypothetical protein
MVTSFAGMSDDFEVGKRHVQSPPTINEVMVRSEGSDRLFWGMEMALLRPPLLFRGTGFNPCWTECMTFMNLINEFNELTFQENC